jgi:hypothetical protein
VRLNENNHLGEGLWLLLQLVRQLEGSLWAFTGDAELLVVPRDSRGRYRRPDGLVWRGLAIEVSLPLSDRSAVITDRGEDDLARRLGF